MVNFFKRGSVSKTAFPNPTYPDLYDNNLTTADIAAGIHDSNSNGVPNKSLTAFMIADLPIPNKPSFGEAKLSGLRLGAYVNSIKVGDQSSITGIKAYKLNVNIGDNEGGKSSSTGSLVNQDDIIQISAVHNDEGATIGTDFSGFTNTKRRVQSSGGIFEVAEHPYLTRDKGYAGGRRFGQLNNGGIGKELLSSDEHFKRFGTTLPDVGEVYQIRTANDTDFLIDAESDDWFSVKEYPTWGYNYEVWFNNSVTNRAIQYGKRTPVAEESFVEKLSTDSGFFDTVVDDREYFDFGLQGELQELRNVAHSTAVIGTTSISGNALHMKSLYTHRENTSENIFYRRRGSGAGSELQQVSFVHKELPIPTHLYSRQPVAAGNGRQPVMPTVEFTVKFEELAALLERDTKNDNQISGEDLDDFKYRLNRSFVITFGEERPQSGDNLYDYVIKHTPNAAAVGEDSEHGAGTGTLKSFYGIAFVNQAGAIGYYLLQNSGKQGTVYTDVEYRLDANKGEVCFINQPSFTGIASSLESGWVTISIQQHPDHHGAYLYISDVETGKTILTPIRLTNVKNTTASGSVGLWDTNMSTTRPRHMTLWNNNYQQIRGSFDTTEQKHKTGLRATADGNTTDALRVYSDKSGFGLEDTNYLIIDSGSKVAIGAGASGKTIESNNRTYNNGLSYTLTSNDNWSANDVVFFSDDYRPDPWSGSDLMDMKTSIHIDSIKLKQFSMKRSNATNTDFKTNLARLQIETKKLPNTAFTEGGATVNNLSQYKTQQPSYLCFGFNNLTDITTSDLTGEIKRILLNDFTAQAANNTSTIVTNVDSDLSNIRVGFTSSVENYGRQNAADSTRDAGAVFEADIGSAESATFSNNGGSPNFSFRGLRVGDLDTAANEFSVEADGSGSDGVGNVDYFSQKGMIKYRLDILNDRVSASGATVNNGGVIAADATSFTASDGSLLTDEGFIKIGSEVMKVTNISSNTITVTRGIQGTTAAEQSNGATINNIALPEARECIFASARIVGYKNNLPVFDDMSIFNNNLDETYILYQYNDSYTNPTGLGTGITLKVKNIDYGNKTVEFDSTIDLSENDFSDYLISPQRYWLIVEILNIGGAHGWQDDSSSTVYLSDKSYLRGIGISEKGTYGVTWNESLFNDGRYINSWNLDTYNVVDEGAVELQTDFGFGAFNAETGNGGYAALKTLNITTDVDNYIEVDCKGAIENNSEGLKEGDTMTFMFTPKTTTDNYAINVDTEIGTNPLYVTAEFEDELPVVNDFTVSPNKEDAYFVDFNWKCPADDAWYGFLIIDERTINSQYKGAILHYPFNEAGGHGLKVPTSSPPVDQIQGTTTAVSSTSTTGPFYDVEGLAGNCIRFNDTGTPFIEIGSGSANPLNVTNHAVSKEMSIVVHLVHDSDTDGTLGNAEFILFKSASLDLTINTDGTVRYRQYWDANDYIQLTSTSKVNMDGETPNNIIVTFDASLTSGNVKLFIDGKLEDLTGQVVTTDSNAENTGWKYDTSINHPNNTDKLLVGNSANNGEDEFLGRLEELVFYNQCIYPVKPTDGKFTLTKPLKELGTASTTSSSISYSARLFVKDYHNIRGSTLQEVAATSNISFKKAAFRLNYT
jgi:hypothetical protein